MSLDQREEETTTTVPAPPCGDPNDGDEYFLWTEVKKFVPCDGHRSVVAHGTAGSSKHYLLVPTARVRGIECECIQGGWDYWQDAIGVIPEAFKDSPVSPIQVGLGINSAYARKQEQLHIHIAPFWQGAQDKLEMEKSKGIITDVWAKWPVSIVQIGTKENPNDLRQYRVIRTGQITSNLFAALKSYVQPTSMADETMILIPQKSGGWYVLNSDERLKSPAGSSTCDHLLVYS
ncbi:CDP-diacylglycerol diphosphatase [Streptomyces sp. NPDC057456]|uniref:CDP-diacylglycerol diphosphatase n=1 Tax=Streptomyces sp. NPDC057456 TaxID=3346139 RepID=UPI00367B6CB3